MSTMVTIAKVQGAAAIRPSVGSRCGPFLMRERQVSLPFALRAGSLLAGVDDLHHLRFLAVQGLEDVGDDPVVTFDDHLVAALDLLAGQRAAFLRGANQLRAGGVEAAEAMRDRSAQAAGAHGRELLLAVVVAEQSQSFK